MIKTLRIVAGVAFAAILLSACRYDATYTIHPDGTVSGRIYTAGWLDPGDPTTHDTVKAYIDTDADNIAAAFTTAVKSAYVDGDWYGYYIVLEDEPIPSFSDPAQAAWDIQIIKTGDVYRVNGFEFDDDDDAPRPQARDNGGYITLDVRAPGELEIAISATSATESPCRIQWDYLNVVPVGTTPYAICDNTPEAPPDPPPDPDPAVTIVITPDPDPVVTPVVTPDVSPTPPPDPAPGAGDDGDSIPMWVWGVGAGLVAALAGTIGFAVANKNKTPAPAPAAKSEAKEESDKDESDEDESDEEEKPKKKKK